MYWYRREPQRDGGWETTRRQALSGVGMASLQRSVGVERPCYEQPRVEFFEGATDPDSHYQVTPMIGEMYSETGFLDLNGDGQVDYVDTSSVVGSGYWDVWLGTGKGFMSFAMQWPAPVAWLSRTDEGKPWVTVTTIDVNVAPIPELYDDLAFDVIEDSSGGSVGGSPIHTTIPFGGNYQAQIGGLLDMDGDGRQDLIDGTFWYRNLGDGFDVIGEPMPAWFPEASVVSTHVSMPVLSLTRTEQVTAVSSTPSLPPAVEDASSTGMSIEQVLAVRDVDGDRLPDVISLLDDDDVDPYVLYSGRRVNAIGIPEGSRPGLLEEVTLGTGAVTTIEYGSSSTVWPVGTPGCISVFDPTTGEVLEPCYATPHHKDIVERVTVFDPVTGWESESLTSYERGRVDDGVWLGFYTVLTEEWSSEFDLTDNSRSTWDSYLLGTTHTIYELGRDYTLPARRTIRTVQDAGWAAGSSNGELIDRYKVEWTYEDHGPVGGARSRWPVGLDVTEYSEVRSDPTLPQESREFSVSQVFDAHGNVLVSTHESLDRPEDLVQVDATWAGNANGSLWVPRTLTTSSLSATGSLEAVESGDFAYDDGTFTDAPSNGLLTQQDVCAGASGTAICSDVLSWVFTRNLRGAVTQIDAPAGRNSYFPVWGFGDTVATTEQNALSHTTNRFVDDLGRIVEEVDPNGVSRRTTYDAFGRVAQVEERGAGATDWLVREQYDYEEGGPLADGTWDPAITYITRPTYHSDGSLGPYNDVEAQVLDGFGGVVQTWKTKTGGGWVVQEVERDTRGNERWVSEPHYEPALSFGYLSHRASATTQRWAYYDLLGAPVTTWSIAEGRTDYEVPLPGTIRRIMEDDYVTHEVHDTHGRLIEVWQDRTSDPNTSISVSVTGAYTWDGRDRVTEFVDNAKNAWRYVFDGAGRVQSVQRRPGPTGAWADYYAFQWDGPDPIAQYEGSLATGQLVASWYYDALGRTTEKAVWDDASSGFHTFTWTWDLDTSGAGWIGARRQTTDPTGITGYAYAPDPVFGGFGKPTSLVRLWNDGKTASVSRSYDFAGRVASATSPTGAKVDNTYDETGRLVAQDAVVAGTTLSVGYDVDDYGLPAGWDLSVSTGDSWSHDIYRFNSQQIDELAWHEVHTGSTHAAGYLWQANGWLENKVLTGMEPLRYHYDHLGRIDGLYSGPIGTGIGSLLPLETYRYDAGHNPVEFYRDGVGTWGYDPPVGFNEVPGRERPTTGGGLVTETMTWDPVTGRLETWNTSGATPNVQRTYTYDGAGRLRVASKLDPSGLRTHRMFYDVDDNLITTRKVKSGTVATEYRFEGWQENTFTGVVIEQLLPMVRIEDGDVRVLYAEPDGHALWTRSDAGPDTFEPLGVYGLPLERYASTDRWDQDALHGQELDRKLDLMHLGARHLAMRDGLWMQPEPLLHFGLTLGDIRDPIGFSGLYSAGNTNVFADRSGTTPMAAYAYAAYEIAGTTADIVETATAVSAFVAAPSPVTGAALAWNAGATVLGMATPASGLTKVDDVARAGDKFVDFVKNATKGGSTASGVTPRAARREAMREAGIPTSQQPMGQRSVTTHGPAGEVNVGRQYDYEVPAAGGGTQRMSVQHSLTDDVPGHGPHWEAGKVKEGGQVDSVGRPRLQNDKAKVDE